jgi:cytoskeletal protein CcmA (bactofilin family)
MWNRQKDEIAPPARETPAPPIPVREAAREVRPPEPQQRESALRGGIATIGKNLVVKGNISGGEDLYVDGELEGSVELKDNNITVGPNGRVNANLHARDIVVLGRLKGNVRAVERLEIRKTGSLIGDIVTARVVIEDGAYFKGSIDIQKGAAASAPAPVAPVAQAAAAASGPASTSTPASTSVSTSASTSASTPAATQTPAPALAPAPISATTPAGPSSGFSLSGEPKKY